MGMVISNNINSRVNIDYNERIGILKTLLNLFNDNKA